MWLSDCIAESERLRQREEINGKRKMWEMYSPGLVIYGVRPAS